MFQTIINNKYEAEEEAEKEKAPRGLSIFSKVLELQSGGQRLDMGTVGAGREEGARHACGASAPPPPRDAEVQLGVSPLGVPQGQEGRLAIWSPASGTPFMSVFIVPPRVVQQGGPGTERRWESH